MSEPYVYIDRDGDKLRIGRSDAWSDQIFVRPGGDGAYIAAADLPMIVAKMYEAAGLPNPLADRPGQHVMQDIVDRRDLLIEPSIRADNAVYFGQSSARGWHIRTEDLPELVGALYEAAGKSAPIILDRPDEEDLRGGGWLDGKHVSATEHELGTITPHAARVVAACLAGAADLADAEPDPQLIAHLADVVTRAGVLGSAAETIARAVLAAGFDKVGES